MVSIETDTILVEEVLIKKVVFDLVIHHANAEGSICARSNGNPLVSQRLRRLGSYPIGEGAVLEPDLA